jgi:hypothetical protein
MKLTHRYRRLHIPINKMEIYTKVAKGTPRHDESSLCATCRRAQRISGDSLDDDRTICGALEIPQRITFSVRACSKYDDERLPSIYDMRQAAWILRTDEKKQAIGFVPWKKLEKFERDKIEQEDDY